MPRSRNKETERQICRAAWDLFLEKGVQDTSYTNIAKRSGVTRPLVQRYFPHKELFVSECVDAIRDAAVRVADERFGDELHPLVRLYLRGQVNIAAYFCTEGIRLAMRDVFASRVLTEHLIARNFLWTLDEVMPVRQKIVREDEPDELIMAMGGLYELLFSYLVRGSMPDVPLRILPGILTFSELFDIELPQENIKTYALPEDELLELARRAVELVSWE